MMDMSSVIDATLALLGAGVVLTVGLCMLLDQSTTVAATPSVDEIDDRCQALPKAA
jgi:hypothetical protein